VVASRCHAGVGGRIRRGRTRACRGSRAGRRRPTAGPSRAAAAPRGPRGTGRSRWEGSRGPAGAAGRRGRAATAAGSGGRSRAPGGGWTERRTWKLGRGRWAGVAWGWRGCRVTSATTGCLRELSSTHKHHHTFGTAVNIPSNTHTHTHV